MSAMAPATGMPATQAAGCPRRAHETTRARRSGAAHSAAAASAPETTIPRPAPSASCAPARTEKLGAAALANEPPASSARPTVNRLRRSRRRARGAMASAAMPPAAPEMSRSWPAVAVATPNSRLISGRIGARTRNAAWPANMVRNSARAGVMERPAAAGAPRCRAAASCEPIVLVLAVAFMMRPRLGFAVPHVIGDTTQLSATQVAGCTQPRVAPHGVGESPPARCVCGYWRRVENRAATAARAAFPETPSFA
jgi:hypothetical protein